MKEENHSVFVNAVRLEDGSTELLRNFLQFKIFRDAFLKIFLDDIELINSIETDHIDTQKRLDNKSKPDLLIKNERIEILVEIKVSANRELTENQPGQYLQHLLSVGDDIMKWLLFIVPHNYVHKCKIENGLRRFTRQNPACKTKTRVIHWDEIINAIEKNRLSEASVLIREFNDFLKFRFAFEKIPFTQEEVEAMFDKDVPEMLLKLFRMLHYVRQNLDEQYKPKPVANDEEYGVYFRDSENKNFLFFGIWFSFWKEYGKPLCYGVNLKKYDRGLVGKFTSCLKRRKKQYKDIKDDGEVWRMAWIDEAAFYDENNHTIILQHIQALLDELHMQ